MNTNRLKSKTLGLILSISVILSMVAVAVPATPVQALATPIYVNAAMADDTGDGLTPATAKKLIQSGIGLVSSGGTVNVAVGTYAEHITIATPLTLTGSNQATTIIDGSGTGIVVLVTSSSVNISGFTVRDSGTSLTGPDGGIGLIGLITGCNIHGNIVTANAIGIGLGAGATGNTIQSNTITANQYGIGLDNLGTAATSNIIQGNTITGSTLEGIYMGDGCNSNQVLSNTVTGSTNNGIYLWKSSSNTITGNTFSGNGRGIELMGSQSNTINTNTFASNTSGGILIRSGTDLSNGNIFHYNSIVSNTGYGMSVTYTASAPAVTNAELNWWGSNSTPAAQIVGLVDFTPWIQVAVTLPSGGECIKGGSSYDVTWTSYSATSSLATLYYSTDGSSYTNTGLSITNPTQGPNTLRWTVPSTVNSSTCKVRVKITSNVLPDDSAESGTFTIDSAAPNSLIIGQPVAGAYLKAGTPYTIRWQAQETTLPASTLTYILEYSTTNGSSGSWQNIATFPGLQGTLTQPWTPPAGTDSAICKLRITARDCALNEKIETTGAFTIDAYAPTVTSITAPIVTDIWDTGTHYNITWTATHSLVANINYLLEYSTTGTTPWTNIGTVPAASTGGTYDWQVPVVATSSACKVRITPTDLAGNAGAHVESSTFTIRDTGIPDVQVTSPNSPVTWTEGGNYAITWTDQDVAGTSMTYNLTYCLNYTDNCTLCDLPIDTVTGVPGDHTYTWTIPILVPHTTATNCRVRVEAVDSSNNRGSDCSDSNFTIKTASTQIPTVTLTNPNSGSVQAGTPLNITWTANDPTSDTLNFTLEYSSTGSFPGTNIVILNNRELDGSHNYSGSFAWSVPNTPTTTYRVRVTATNSYGPGYDQSDNTFTVTAADTSGGFGPYSISLTAGGWNLISLQAFPTSTNIESVLASVLPNVVSVWYIQPEGSGCSGINCWKSYSPSSAAASSLHTMEDGKAYYVKVSSNCILTYQGRKSIGQQPNPPYNVYTGWNMVGYKSTQTGTGHTAADYFTVAHTIIWRWDSTLQDFVLVTNTTPLTPGTGYWVQFTANGQVSGFLD